MRIKLASAVVAGRQPGRRESATIVNGRTYRHGVTNPGGGQSADVGRYIAETAERIHRRLADVSSSIRVSLEDEIPELRADPRLIELLDASVEGNVETLLQAMRHDIPVQRVDAPAAAVEYARRLAQHGVPLNALVRAYRLGQRQMNGLVFSEAKGLEVAESVRFAMLEAITTTLFEYIDRITQQVIVVYEDERVTFEAFWRAAAAIARELQSLGIAKGDRVAILAPQYPGLPAGSGHTGRQNHRRRRPTHPRENTRGLDRSQRVGVN